eukprot:TRINITY_DN7222_c0_g1_i1.p1 TRINITY_DN7222_c0_g1~~TRINITY_DN7222_c0_g1_i1.p1  ORF type:complete len:135 (+),score=35.34 TRINITY_DN7222_c0_g1_i1:3-407(+)
MTDLCEHWCQDHPVSTSGTPACLVLEGLWVGNVENAQDQAFLLAEGITHVLNATIECPAAPECTTTHRWPLQDTQAQEIVPEELEVACAFVEAGLSAGGVLIHCAAGRSRACLLYPSDAAAAEDSGSCRVRRDM